MIPTKQTRHVEDGTNKLTGAWWNKPRAAALLASYLKQIQQIENAYYDVLIARLLENAIGVYLDILGRIVGEPRAGKSDARFRLAITIKARVNRSHGRVLDILEILDLATDVWAYREVYPAKFRIDVGEMDGRELARWIRKAKAGGVGFELVYRPRGSVGFKWGHTTPGSVQGAGKWAHTVEGSVPDAGEWADVVSTNS